MKTQRSILDSEPRVQLDIFEHSREVMLRNDVVLALEQRDKHLARLGCDRLLAEYPVDDALPALGVLTVEIEREGSSDFLRYEDLSAARHRLEKFIRPAALRTFGEKAAIKWLGASWEDLARRAKLLTFSSDNANDHAAALWLQAFRWQDAAQSVSSIESWRHIPTPLAWMCEARLHLIGLQATWPILAELCWLSPRRVAELAARSPDPLLPQLMGQFEADFDGTGDTDGTDDLAWFAAWVLTERPRLVEHLAAAQAAQHSLPEQALRLLVELLGLERQGRHNDLVRRRKALRDLQPSLYAAYMKSR